MFDLLTLAIGVGLAISLIFSEIFGLAPGGLIVPGYFAIYFDKPIFIISTILIGFLTFAIVRALSSILIIYGRRRTVLTILLGYLLGMAFRFLATDIAMATGLEFNVIGYIIPGLIAIWLDRQGVVTTISTLMIVSTIVRLVLILTLGTEIKL